MPRVAACNPNPPPAVVGGVGCGGGFGVVWWGCGRHWSNAKARSNLSTLEGEKFDAEAEGRRREPERFEFEKVHGQTRDHKNETRISNKYVTVWCRLLNETHSFPNVHHSPG